MKTICYLNACTIVLLLTAACNSHPGDHSHDHPGAQIHGPASGTMDDGHGTVSLTPVQMQSIELRTDTITHRNLTSRIKANGFLKVPNQNKATVTSLYSGMIQSIHVVPGSQVTRGQTIATIVNPEFLPMQEEFLSLAPKIDLAEAEYQRQQDLNAGNAGALKNLQNAESTLNALLIRRTSLGKQLTLMGIDAEQLNAADLVSRLAIKSPLNGSVADVLVNIGTSVNSMVPIAELVDHSQLHLDLFVYEKDLIHVKKGQGIDFILTNRPGSSYSAEVFSIGTKFENESRAVAVHCIVNGDKQGLIEGMSVTAMLTVNNETVPALPEAAIVNSDGMDFVFVLTEDTHEGTDHSHDEEEIAFKRIPVRTGVSELGFTEITLLEDVDPGAMFVVHGAFFLESKLTNTGEAHAH